MEVDVVTEEQIRELAYYIWEQEGRPEGKSEEHYFRAKRMLEEQEAASLLTRAPVTPSWTLPPPSPPKPTGRRTPKRRPK